MNKNKEFDCVEMKRKGSEELRKKIDDFTIEEELKFWAERTKKLKIQQQKLRKKQKNFSRV